MAVFGFRFLAVVGEKELSQHQLGVADLASLHVLIKQHPEAEERLSNGLDDELVGEHVFGEEVGEKGIRELLLGEGQFVVGYAMLLVVFLRPASQVRQLLVLDHHHQRDVLDVVPVLVVDGEFTLFDCAEINIDQGLFIEEVKLFMEVVIGLVVGLVVCLGDVFGLSAGVLLEDVVKQTLADVNVILVICDVVELGGGDQEKEDQADCKDVAREFQAEAVDGVQVLLELQAHRFILCFKYKQQFVASIINTKRGQDCWVLQFNINVICNQIDNSRLF